MAEPATSMAAEDSSTPKVHLTMHGAFRSGTNFVKTLLEVNWDVQVHNGRGGFKHAPIPALFADATWTVPDVVPIGVVKDPWAWLVSMWRFVEDRGGRHVEVGETWSAFLRSPIVVTDATFEGFPRFWYASPVDYWLAMADSITSSTAWWVRYEDVLAAPWEVMARGAEQLGLDRTSDDFVVPRTRTMNMRDRGRSRLDEYVSSDVFDAAWYRDEAYLAEFSPEDRAAVILRLDRGVVTTAGYEWPGGAGGRSGR